MLGQEYSQKAKQFVDHIRFEHQGGEYVGNGILNWDPNKGFHLDAFLKRSGPALPETQYFGKAGAIAPSDLRSLRMRWKRGDEAYAISPKVEVGDGLALSGGKQLEIDFPSLLAVRNSTRLRTDGRHSGTCLINIGKGIVLPDLVESESRISGDVFQRGFTRSAITHEDAGFDLRAWVRPDGLLHAEYDFKGAYDAKRAAWRFSKALELALSIVSGVAVRLVERSCCRGDRWFVERFRLREPIRFELLSPIRYRGTVPKKFLLQVAGKIVVDKEFEFITARIVEQLTDAAQQRTWEARELLCANTLDAALRTLAGKPYKRQHRDTYIEQCMSAFREAHLPDGWEEACNRVLRSYHDLRHRNAHPDWLTTSGGQLSKEGVGKRIDDLIRVCTFCGSIVLALAGLKPLASQFPNPIDTWGPLITITPARSVP
ncbi:MAG: hypothetical protein IID35_09045 [Planctomycetes bacterium]|nr:hypothetical protein [Planctomycetota bacterium]